VYLAFSSDGVLLASAGSDKMVSIWDTASGKEIKKLAGFRDHVHSVAFSPDGRLLAAGDWSGQIRMWAVHTWEELDRVEHRLGKEIWNVAFSPAGNYFAASGLGGLEIWSVVERAGGARPKLQEIPGPPDKNITSVCYSPEGNLLAWVSRGKKARGGHAVHLWDFQKCQARPAPTSRLAQYYSAIAFYPDGERLTYINEQDEIEVWDAARDQRAYCYGRGEIKQGSGEVALSADGALFAVGGTRTVTVWDTKARKLLFALPEEHSFCSYLAWSPSRQLLAVGSADGGIAIWNIPQIRAQLAEIELDW
jgi:WD40 repeat protein